MDSPQCNVVVDGTVLDGFDAGTVATQLQQQLKLAKPLALALVANKIITVKRNIDAATANTYCTRLRELGVSARVEIAAAGLTGAGATENDASTPTAATGMATANDAEPVTPTEAAATSATDAQTHYFPATPLAAADIKTTSAFRRGVTRAALACTLTVLGYLALAGVGVIFFLFYLVRSAYLFTSPVLLSTTAYLVSVLLLAILVALLLRPLLSRRRESDAGIQVSPLQQPELFACVAQLCDMLQLPVPQQIAVSTATTNSVALLPGLKNLWRGEYRLTLSLPAMENGSFSQFAAVLAADLATQTYLPLLRYRHLAAGAGARLADCLANRDRLGGGLARLTQAAPAKLKGVLEIGKQIVEQANSGLRKIAARLQRIETRLQNALLHEQDRYSALLAGSEHFAALLVFRARLEAAARDAVDKNLEDRLEGGLVDDLPALIRHYCDGTDENFTRELQREWADAITPRRGEAPLVRERIERVTQSAQPGIVITQQPARALLQQRDDIAQRATLAAYTSAGLHYDRDTLLPVEDLTYAATQDMLLRQQAAVYFNGWFQPFRFWNLADYKLIRDMPSQDAAAQLSVCVNEIRRLTPDRARLLAEYERVHNQLREILLAQHVLAAGKKFAFRYISYDGTSLAPELEQRQQQLAAIMEKLAQQETVMGGRITLGLRLSGQDENAVQELHDTLRLLHGSSARLHKIALDCYQLEQLLQRHHQVREADYSQPIKKLETKIDDTCTLLMVRLNDIPYPLDPRHRSLKSFIEAALEQPADNARSPALQRAQRLLNLLYHVNEKLSRQAADYGTIAEEAYRIEPIKLIGNE